MIAEGGRYLHILFHPFRNLASFVLLLLLVFIFSGGSAFLFLNAVYHRHFVEQLIGIYPPLMTFDSLKQTSPDTMTGENVLVLPEFFQKKADVSFFNEAGDETVVSTGVKSYSSTHCDFFENLNVSCNTGASVFMSSSLSDILFNEMVEDRDIYLLDRKGKKKKLSIKKTFTLSNNERWILIPKSEFDQLELSFNVDKVISFYPGKSSPPFSHVEKEVRTKEPEIKLVYWSELLPLFYRCTWDIVQNSFVFILALTLLVLTLFLIIFFWASYLRMRNIIALLRSFGTPHRRMLSAVCLRLLVCFVALFLFANVINVVVIYFIDVPRYSLTTAEYIRFISNYFLGNIPAALSLILLYFSMVAVVFFDIYCRQIARIWR